MLMARVSTSQEKWGVFHSFICTEYGSTRKLELMVPCGVFLDTNKSLNSVFLPKTF